MTFLLLPFGSFIFCGNAVPHISRKASLPADTLIRQTVEPSLFFLGRIAAIVGSLLDFADRFVPV